MLGYMCSLQAAVAKQRGDASVLLDENTSARDATSGSIEHTFGEGNEQWWLWYAVDRGHCDVVEQRDRGRRCGCHALFGGRALSEP